MLQRIYYLFVRKEGVRTDRSMIGFIDLSKVYNIIKNDQHVNKRIAGKSNKVIPHWCVSVTCNFFSISNEQ